MQYKYSTGLYGRRRIDCVGAVRRFDLSELVKNKKSVNEEESFTASASQTRKTLVVALLTHLAGGVFVGIICGAFTGMPLPKMILWVVWTAVASVASMVIIGKAAMYSGWFPDLRLRQYL